MTDEETQAAGPSVLVESHDAIAIVHINNPAERNALSISVINELDKALSALTSHTDISSIIFTGTDDVFASGANLRELQRLTPETARAFAQMGQRFFKKIDDAPQLTIAAINGYCMGGGLDLALSCDLRCASPDAIFAHPGARLGIITGWGGTQRLPRLIGQTRALEIFFTARHITAREALEIGLVQQVSDDVVRCAVEMAKGRK